MVHTTRADKYSWKNIDKFIGSTLGMSVLSASLIQLEYVPKQWKSTFSYSPLVLWWPPLSHFRKKGIFLGLSLVSTSTLKYLQSPPH